MSEELNVSESEVVSETNESTDSTAEPAVESPEKQIEQRKFSAFARQERKLREKAQALAAQQAEIKQFNELKSKAKETPLEVLERLGITLEDIGTQVLGKAEPTKDEKIELLAKEWEEYKAAAIEKEKAAKQAAENAAIERHQSKITEYVKTHSDKYELLTQTNNVAVVWDIIEQEYMRSNGENLLSIEAAADMAESYFENQVKQTLMNSKKAKALFATLNQDENNTGSKTPEDERKVFKTLTNKSTSAPVKQIRNSNPDEDETTIFQKMLRYKDL